MVEDEDLKRTFKHLSRNTLQSFDRLVQSSLAKVGRKTDGIMMSPDHLNDSYNPA